jgi:hypothetical protein
MCVEASLASRKDGKVYLRCFRWIGIALLCVSLDVLLGVLPAGAVPPAQHVLQGHPILPEGSRQAVPRLVSTATVLPVHTIGHRIVVPPRPAPAGERYRGPVPHGGAITITLPAGNRSPNIISHASFAGQSQDGWEPSDSNASAGPYDVVETVNEEWAIYGRSGGQEYQTSFDAWFGQTISLFDPKVIYDPWGGRFIMLVDTGSSLLLSVSQQSDAFGNWCNYTFPTVSGLFADYPQLGVDPQGIYFTANLYGSTFDYAELFNANSAEMESCQTTSYYYWTNLKYPDGSSAFTVVPAITHSAASYEYLVSSYAGGGCSFAIWDLTGSLLYGSYKVNSRCYSPPPPAAQPGTTTTIETLDNRLYQASYLNGLLDIATASSYNWGGGNINAVVMWFKINPGTLTMTQQGSFGRSGYWVFFPGFEQDSNGNAVVVFDVSSVSVYPSIYYVGMTASGGIENKTAYVLALGVSYYTDGNPTARWGDFQSAMLDPTDATQIWITGQYAAATNTWGTWMGDISA